jgi:hypothetical protein
MRKVIDDLDADQREALLYLVDLGTAACSAGLIVGMLKLLCDLFS